MSMKIKKFAWAMAYFLIMLAFWMLLLSTPAIANAQSKPPKNTKSKFYDFSDQLIDGEIKKPAALYTSSRAKVKFERLLRLKRSFLPDLMETAKQKVFK